MVMRGDGGATDPAGLRREPARALYSGPAASVAGVLRHTRLAGGHRHRGRRHVDQRRRHQATAGRRCPTCRWPATPPPCGPSTCGCIGVAGGSMLRARKGRLYGVGPRSAHIAGLPYSLLPARGRPVAARDAELVAPRPDDPADYVVLRLADGSVGGHHQHLRRRRARRRAARRPRRRRRRPRRRASPPSRSAGALLGLDGDEAGRRGCCAPRRRRSARSAMRGGRRVRPGASRRSWRSAAAPAASAAHVARRPRPRVHVPELAEVISAVGDALSLVRVERERSVTDGHGERPRRARSRGGGRLHRRRRRPRVGRRAGRARRRPHHAPRHRHGHGGARGRSPARARRPR